MTERTANPRLTLSIAEIRKGVWPRTVEIVNPLLEKERREKKKAKALKQKISLEKAREAALRALQVEISIKALTQERNQLLAQVLAYQLQQGVTDFAFNPEDPEDRYHLTETEKVELEQSELAQQIPSSLWRQITDSVRVVNPSKLERALNKGVVAPRTLENTIKISVTVDTRYQRPKVKALKRESSPSVE